MMMMMMKVRAVAIVSLLVVMSVRAHCDLIDFDHSRVFSASSFSCTNRIWISSQIIFVVRRRRKNLKSWKKFEEMTIEIEHSCGLIEKWLHSWFVDDRILRRPPLPKVNSRIRERAIKFRSQIKFDQFFFKLYNRSLEIDVQQNLVIMIAIHLLDAVQLLFLFSKNRSVDHKAFEVHVADDVELILKDRKVTAGCRKLITGHCVRVDKK